MKVRAIVMGIIISLIVCVNANAGPTNLGFETNDLTGWTFDPNGGSYNIVGSYTTDTPYTYNPTEGTLFLKLTAGSTGKTVQVYQVFTATAGEVVTGMVGFDAKDAQQNDIILISFLGVDYDPVYTVGSKWNGDQPWTQWSWTAPEDGTYKLTYGVKNVGNSLNSSVGLFDAVPIPPTVLLFGTAMIGLLGIRRRIVTK